MYYLREEESSDVTGMAIEMIQELFETLGPACFDKNLDDISSIIVKLLENVDEEEEDDEDKVEDEDEEEAEAYILEGLSDLIPLLCKLCGD